MRRSLPVALLALTTQLSTPLPVATQDDRSLVGEWSPVQSWYYRAIHAALLPTAKVVY
jgi:hypothetical protein